MLCVRRFGVLHRETFPRGLSSVNQEKSTVFLDFAYESLRQ
jgi:hypothetical protein